MEIIINTKQKTIKLEGNYTLGYILETLEEFMPNGSWAEYVLVRSNKCLDYKNSSKSNKPIHYPYRWYEKPTVYSNE